MRRVILIETARDLRTQYLLTPPSEAGGDAMVREQFYGALAQAARSGQ
jgi:hypothetical protein